MAHWLDASLGPSGRRTAFVCDDQCSGAATKEPCPSEDGLADASRFGLSRFRCSIDCILVKQPKEKLLASSTRNGIARETQLSGLELDDYGLKASLD